MTLPFCAMLYCSDALPGRQFYREVEAPGQDFSLRSALGTWSNYGERRQDDASGRARCSAKRNVGAAAIEGFSLRAGVG
jgi:hypothetical protein